MSSITWYYDELNKWRAERNPQMRFVRKQTVEALREYLTFRFVRHDN